MASKKKTPQTPSNDIDPTKDALILGHLIKYNLYLVAKSIVFSALASKCTTPQEAVDLTNKIMTELDLDAKQRSESVS